MWHAKYSFNTFKAGPSFHCTEDDSEAAESAAASDVKEDESPPSPADVRENIRSKFLVEMPEDFYEFWEFAKSLDSKKPTGLCIYSLFPKKTFNREQVKY